MTTFLLSEFIFYPPIKKKNIIKIITENVEMKLQSRQATLYDVPLSVSCHTIPCNFTAVPGSHGPRLSGSVIVATSLQLIPFISMVGESLLLISSPFWTNKPLLLSNTSALSGIEDVGLEGDDVDVSTVGLGGYG